MTYQVLARKYRPQTLAQVVGQEHVTVTLANAIAAKRVHHAYLFTGARGVGKTTVARILAKALNCKERSTPEPCEVCGSCKEITAGASLDVQEIDGASNTGVDDIREIRDRVRYLPSSSIYKIYIIDEVHMLSTNAFNALLKTLEEPPAHVVFIFATTEPQKIPATILSRCQRYDFRRIPVQRIVLSLRDIANRESVAVSDDVLRLVAREASGSMRDAQSLFDQAIAFSAGNVTLQSIALMLGFLDRKLLFDFVSSVLQRDAKGALVLLEEVFVRGADLARFGHEVLECLRHLLVLAECDGDLRLVDLPEDEVKLLKELVSGVEPEVLQQMFALWYTGAEEVARSTLPKMLFEVLTLRLCRVESVRPIGELIARVEELAQDSATSPLGETSIPVAASTTSSSPPDQWPAFLRWLVVEEPRVASLLGHGTLVSCDGCQVVMRFDNPLYADMLEEVGRKEKVEGLLTSFFKRSVSFRAERSLNGAESPLVRKAEENRALTREALESPIVRDAAEILGARIHDIKTIQK